MLEYPRGRQPVGLVADRPLSLTADEFTVVDANDPRSRYVLVGAAGAMIDQWYVDKLGLELVDGKIVQRVAAPVVEAKAEVEDEGHFVGDELVIDPESEDVAGPDAGDEGTEA